MKTNAVVLIVSAGVGAALVGVGACSSMMGNKPKKVVIEDGRIFIPGTSVSQADQDSVMAILGQYKRSLYKIQTYKDGNPSGKPHGALADKIIGEATVAQVASDAKQNALSGWGIQIGSSSSSHPTTQPSPTPQPSGSPSHPTTVQAATPSGSPSHPQKVPADEAASRELVSKVAPILRKYSQ
ncbi:MAG: hypothetical protein DMF15_08940 [Verrucomicrobia bacterium]|nr:MAG: hypothetical protein DMF15_08940 [Verrucomicrobiota bacterium]